MAKKYIVVIDDDSHWLARMKAEVSSFGLEIVEADGYHAGRDRIRDHKDGLALVVCDNMMPLGGRQTPNLGIEIRQEMVYTSKELEEIPFILFTSEISDEMRAVAEELGAVVVLKRYNYDGDVTAAARKILEPQ